MCFVKYVFMYFCSIPADNLVYCVLQDEDENDEFSHFNDEEEFIGYDSERPQGARASKAQEEPKITIANVS